MTPAARLFRTTATIEAVTWALLLAGMFVKYVLRLTPLGVTIAGSLHGAAFLAYCAATLWLAWQRKWPVALTVAGLAASIPPFATWFFERFAEKRGLVAEAARTREPVA